MEQEFSAGGVIIFVLIVAAIAYFGYRLYKRRELEKERKASSPTNR